MLGFDGASSIVPHSSTLPPVLISDQNTLDTCYLREQAITYICIYFVAKFMRMKQTRKCAGEPVIEGNKVRGSRTR